MRVFSLTYFAQLNQLEQLKTLPFIIIFHLLHICNYKKKRL